MIRAHALLAIVLLTSALAQNPTYKYIRLGSAQDVTTKVSAGYALMGGGSDLRNFGEIIFIGIIIGTFSSIFIASPVVLWWSNRKGGNIREAVLATVAKAESISAAP